MSINAPYNFVPLNDEIFYPSWHKDVSHDIPFSDGESALVDISIEAKSPIFIKNHTDDENKKVHEFCHHINADGAKEYYIPGSSIKGVVRSVLEILSFSKIRVDEEKLSQPLSVRDMANRKELVGTATGAGVLFLNQDGTAYIADYGAPRTIDAKEIKKAYKNYSLKSDALSKYKAIRPHSKIMVKGYIKDVIKNGKKIGTKRDSKYSENGEAGMLLFSTHMGRKHHEFILLKSDIKNAKREISATTLKKFKNVYFADGDSDTHKLGAFWKKQDRIEGIPVFYVEKNGQISDIGLTQLFKLSYNKTLLEASKQKSDATKLDLAQTIFGTTQEKLELKGRVQFSHLKSTTIKFEKTQKSEVLGSPNPTYYPNYIRQKNVQGDTVLNYTTLMNAKAQIAGYKRYPLHSSIMSSTITNENEKIKTHFKPLEEGTHFEGKIRFHNLKKAEIGALLSAITFHGHEKTNLHNIGMAKSLGYGKIAIQLDLRNLKHSKEEYLKAFEEEISKEIPKWKNSPQLKELLAMSSIECKSNEKLQYQLLSNTKGKNDFVVDKSAKKYLQSHSQTNPMKSVKDVMHNLKEKKEKNREINSAQKTPPTLSISNNQMTNALQSSWRRVFGILFLKPHIYAFRDAKLTKITDIESRNIYETLDKSKYFHQLISELCNFFDKKIDNKRAEALYERIKKLK